jgi:hypothetical protein
MTDVDIDQGAEDEPDGEPVDGEVEDAPAEEPEPEAE